MPEYLHPGVYVEEVDAGPKPIEGVSTSTAGAVGVTERGPTDSGPPYFGKPVLCTSFADFERKFGSFLEEPPPADRNRWDLDSAEGGRWWQFPLSVKGFFDNGGQRLYVKRVFASTAVASGAALGQGLVAAIAADANAGATHDPPAAHASASRTRGPSTSSRRAPRRCPATRTRCKAYDAAGYGHPDRAAAGRRAGGARRGGDQPAQRLAGARERHDRALQRQVPWRVGRLRQRARASDGRRHADHPARPGHRRRAGLHAAHRRGRRTAPTSRSSPPSASRPATASASWGASSRVTVVDGTNFTVAPPVGATVTWATGTSVARLRPAGNGTGMNLGNAASLYDNAVLEFDNGTQKETVVVAAGGVVGSVVTFAPALANAYFEGHKARVVEMEVAARYTQADGRIVAQETIQNLRLHDDQSTQLSSSSGIGLQSSLVDADHGAARQRRRLLRRPTSRSSPTSPAGEWVDLTGGDDDLAAAHRSTTSSASTAAAATAPASRRWRTSTRSASCARARDVVRHRPVGAHPALRAAQDRFAIIDPPDGLRIEGIRDFREPIDTKYAALYYPWLEVRDPSVRRNVVRRPVGAHGRHLRPRRRGARRAQGAGQRGDPRHHPHRAGRRPSASRTCSTRRASTPCASSPAAATACGARARCPPTRRGSTSTCGGSSSSSRSRSTRARSGWSSSPTTSRCGRACAPAITNFLTTDLAQRRAAGHDAGGGVLRQVRPHDHDPGRHRQRPPHLRHRHRSGEAGRVRDLPHPAEDAREPSPS